MLRKKLAESLTARIFLITALILLCAGTVTFGMIAWATPLTYTSVFNDDLARQVDDFAATLADTNLEDCGPCSTDLSDPPGQTPHSWIPTAGS